MWYTGWRDEIWNRLKADEQETGPSWDVLVIGGGITGAGILREATRLGLRTLLVEKNDFSWGTSSRSSKLVHGGLRYLRNLQIGLTRASVRERERLLEEGPGLIDPMGFLLTTYKGDRPPGWVFEAALTVYDLLALQWSHQQYDAHEFQLLAPHITTKGLQGGFRYGDAQTDDARLVLRIIREAVHAGGVALNYVTAESLLQDADGNVNGALLRDTTHSVDQPVQVRARIVINATGAWADQLRQQVGGPSRIRPLRGSHLIFPAWKLPVAQAISFLHPRDRRPVFIFPWEGITLVGTTDVDHESPLDDEPGINGVEFIYLMEAVKSQFASLSLTKNDVLSTFAGVRPVIGTGKADPSKESRDHVLWEEQGLLTVTGGKLTTFRLIALDALKAARQQVPNMPKVHRKHSVLDPVDVELIVTKALDEEGQRRLIGRYGADAPAMIKAAVEGELKPISGTKALWAELRWAAKAEGVVHLDDLLLRRVRLGLLTADGGLPIIDRVRAIAQPELGWDDERWEQEVHRYTELWHNHYSVPQDLPDRIDETQIELKRIAGSHPAQPKAHRQAESLLWGPGWDGRGPSYRLYLGLAFLIALALGLLLRRREKTVNHY